MSYALFKREEHRKATFRMRGNEVDIDCVYNQQTSQLYFQIEM